MTRVTSRRRRSSACLKDKSGAVCGLTVAAVNTVAVLFMLPEEIIGLLVGSAFDGFLALVHHLISSAHIIMSG